MNRFTNLFDYAIITVEVTVMKKIFALLLVFLFIFCGCAQNQNSTELTIKDGGFFEYTELAEQLGKSYIEAGVKIDGFVNTQKSDINNIHDAIELAKKEVDADNCTIAEVTYTEDKEFYRVLFMIDYETVGGGATVYLDKNGITKVIIYGEYKITQGKTLCYLFYLNIFKNNFNYIGSCHKFYRQSA